MFESKNWYSSDQYPNICYILTIFNLWRFWKNQIFLLGDKFVIYSFQAKLAKGNCVESLIIFTGETGFTRNRVFNFHANHIWTDDNLHSQVQRRHSCEFSLHFWRGIIGENVLVSIFLPRHLNCNNYTHFFHVFGKILSEGYTVKTLIEITFNTSSSHLLLQQ